MKPTFKVCHDRLSFLVASLVLLVFSPSSSYVGVSYALSLGHARFRTSLTCCSLMSVRALCFSLRCVIYSHLNASHVSPQPSAPLCSPICLVSTSSWLCTCHLDALGSGLFKCVSLAVQHRLSELDFHRVSCRRELLYIIDEFYTCLRLAILKHTDLI